MIRLILQQAEKAGLLEKVLKNQVGRRLTIKGKQLLDSIKTSNQEQ
jgi:ribosomal protein S19E (S16A)